jgi:hypothetical protein
VNNVPLGWGLLIVCSDVNNMFQGWDPDGLQFYEKCASEFESMIVEGYVNNVPRGWGCIIFLQLCE